MTVETFHSMLGWCSVINFGILIYWAAIITFAHDWVYRIRGKWFRLSEEKFDAINYTLMGGFKILIIIFNIVPYFVLHIVK